MPKGAAAPLTFHRIKHKPGTLIGRLIHGKMYRISRRIILLLVPNLGRANIRGNANFGDVRLNAIRLLEVDPLKEIGLLQVGQKLGYGGPAAEEPIGIRWRWSQ